MSPDIFGEDEDEGFPSPTVEVVVLRCFVARMWRELPDESRAKLISEEGVPWTLAILQQALAESEWHLAEIRRLYG
jgi:hypothetical protein